MHPVIDGCIQLRNEHKLTADMIESIDLAVHPIVMELTSKKNPQTGLEGKFSVYYVAALAIVVGRAGEQQFSDAAVRDPVVAALHNRVTTTINSTLAQDQARVKIHLRDGRTIERFIAHAIGSINNPMSDTALESKFADLTEGILAPHRARKLRDLCRMAEKLADSGDIARAATAT